MNKFQKLSQLNKDIELLENAGKLKAANVLHSKFIKEADTDLDYQLQTNKLQFETNFEKVIANNTDRNSLNNAAKALKNLQTLTSSFDSRINEEAKKLLSIYNPRYSDFVNKHLLVSPNQNTQQQVNQTAIPAPATQQSTNPMFTLDQFNSEGELYNAALNKIKQEFLTLDGDRDLGEKVYTDTIVQFSNAKTKRQFANQVQNLRTQAFRRTKELYNQGR